MAERQFERARSDLKPEPAPQASPARRDPVLDAPTSARSGTGSRARAAVHGADRPAAKRAALELQRRHGNAYVRRVLASSSDHAADRAEVTPAVEDAIDRMRGSGRPLDREVRTRFEPLFGADLGHVRVHTGNDADAVSRSLDARAFATRDDLFFRAGEYRPGTSSGRELIAHELVHVLQDHGASTSPQRLAVGEQTGAEERQATEVARMAVELDRLGGTAGGAGRSDALQANGVSVASLVVARVGGFFRTIVGRIATALGFVQGASRSVDLQPVFFRSSAADTAPTGNSWARRLATTRSVWGKLGVTVNALGAVTLTDATHKTGGGSEAEYHAVRALRNGAGVEVFWVDNDMLWCGGGGCVLGGSANAQMVLSDRGTSDTLLAHEFGHAVGLGHPPAGADANTIMTPSGSHSTANPTRNTLGNYNRITWPAAGAATYIRPDV